MNNFKEHAETSGTKILTEMVTEINKLQDHFCVKTSTGKEFKTKKVLLAT
jgi:thioredoxin reductase